MKPTALVRRTTARTLLTAGLVTSLALATGCTKSEDDSGGKPSASKQDDAGQVVASPGTASGPTCTIDAYGGQKTDLGPSWPWWWSPRHGWGGGGECCEKRAA
ncbi:hypothetical protein [Streptomyces arenae]|uniref:hypothetical protein n=1 Tax=Streptomyces arenae TaxID=29301 RepID=UPI00265B0D58|nr:hypothetical protein [Streptomyces arenae]MCG7205475.1 hypothetical protein [Streptomyces arenae]